MEYTCKRKSDGMIHYFKSNDEYSIGEEIKICGELFIITDKN